jgi:phage shock protein C
MYTQQPSDRQLRRDSADKLVAGVCSGIAEYYGISLVFMRICFVLLTLFSGVGIFIYFFLVLIIPGKGKHSSPEYTPHTAYMVAPQPGSTPARPKNNMVGYLFGIIVAGIAGLAGLIKNIETIWDFLAALLR